MNIEDLETLRKKARNIAIIGFLINIAIAVILFLVFKLPPVPFISFVLGIFITALINEKPVKNFLLAFKDVFVLKSLKNVFTDLVYSPEKGLDGNIIEDTGMMNMGDRYSSNDYISGKYKNINVIQADVHIEEEHESTDSDGNSTTTWVTVFRGRWMIFDFNKRFKANIQVCHKRFRNARLNYNGGEKEYIKVMMEDQEFNNMFRTYAQDEHDAFYVLTPSLMGKIKKLSEKISGELLFCFVDNKLHIGIYNNKDSFEHSIFNKIDEDKVIKEVSQDIKLITDFVDELSLDNDLFRREV